LKQFYTSLREQVSLEKKKSIRQKREKIETKEKRTAKEMLDLSLLQFFDGDPTKAFETLEKLTAAMEKQKQKNSALK
ncbi:MAG TPA: hypothetical protein PLY93_09985, partial [Turneriella sp.]|nr:hypothetical protein [Turneriella sp.]